MTTLLVTGGLVWDGATASPRDLLLRDGRIAAVLVPGEGPAEAFRLDAVKGVAVVFRPAEGRKCARSWKITPEVGSDPDFPDITPRDAEAVREWQTRFGKTV